MNTKQINNNKVAIYARVSVESIYTKKESISNQVDYLIKYAKDNDFEIVDIYQDDGISGSSLNRDGLNNLLDDMKKEKFNTILVTSVSRFSRNYLDAGNYLENIFPSYNIRFIAPIDNYDSAYYDDEQSFALLLWLNDMYRKDIGNKIRFANESRSKKKYMSSGGIYGLLEDENKNFIINEEEANVIRLIFKLWIDGYNANKISKYLKENKIINRAYNHYLKTGQTRFLAGIDPNEFDKYLWQPSAIRKIIQNKEYNGYAVNREFIIKNGIKIKNDEIIEIPNALPKIIDDETFIKAQEKFKYHYNPCIRTSKIDRFNNIKCSCGGKLTFNSNRNVYICNKCKVYSINGDKLNKIIENDVRKLIKDITKKTDKVKEAMGIINEKTVAGDINYYYKCKNQIDSKIELLFEDYILGNMTEEDYNNQLNILKDESDDIEQKINDYKLIKIRNKPLSTNFRLFKEKIKKIKINYSKEDLSIFKSIIDEITVEKLGRLKFNVNIKYKI